MKQIPLTQGQVALVDDEDFESLSQHKWSARWHKRTKGFYALRNSKTVAGKKHTILMHREILGLQRGDKLVVDHINHDTLDNRRKNLRACTSKDNSRNMRPRPNRSTGYKGVHWSNSHKKWRAQINVDRKVTMIGDFTTPEDAARAYDAYAVKAFGEFAYLNFPHHIDAYI